jgi:hypothetical protein
MFHPMIRSTMTRGLLAAAAMLLASTATAQAPNANPQAQGRAADPAKNATAAAPATPAAKGDENKENADDKGKDADRAARKAKEHEAQKAMLTATLKAPVDDALKQELRLHAERTARVERIKSVAADAKDADAGERAAKLLAKENARHDKWMDKHAAGAAPTPAAAPPPAVPAATKEGAK